MNGAWHAKQAIEVALPRDVGPRWKPMRLRADGGHLTVWLDGATLAERDLPAGAYGRIGFTVARGKLSVRGWRVLRLDSANASDTLIALNPGLGMTETSSADVSEPRLLHSEKPTYTEDAMLARISGQVELDAIIERDGSVTGVRVIKPLDDGLDRQAINALERWRFEPATFHSQPIRMRITVLLDFTMR